MIRLLKIEWTKIFYYKTTRIFTFIYFAMLILIGVILSFIKPQIGGVKFDIAKLGMFNFPEIWQNITYLVAIFKIFIAVIVITNITNEYSNGTLKQNLIDGLSKKEFIGSKILINIVLAALSSLFVLAICSVLGLIFSTSEIGFIKGIEYILIYFIKLILFFSICLFLSVLLKRSAFAFLGLIVLWMIELIISSIEKMILAVSSGVESIMIDKLYISDFLPLNVSSLLIPFPISFEKVMVGQSLFEFINVNLIFVAAAIIYILLLNYLSYYLLKKRDL